MQEGPAIFVLYHCDIRRKDTGETPTPRKSRRRLTNCRNRNKVAAADPTASSDFPIEDK
jgi:hypothetical protein